jgi:hypothetical protein
MKKRYFFIALIFSFTFLNAQNPDPWVEYMTPSEIHALFAEYTGSFTMEISMSMGEGQEPAIVNVQSEHTMLLGGRYLEMKQHGTMVGMDYQSIITLGFNNTDKKFALTALTNMGTGILSLLGNWDESTKTATLYGQLTHPVTKNTLNIRQTVSFIDSNTILIENYDRAEDKPEKKTMQYKLIRNS